MNDDGDHYDLAHTKVPTPSSVATPSDGHGIPGGIWERTPELEVDLAWHTVGSQ